MNDVIETLAIGIAIAMVLSPILGFILVMRFIRYKEAHELKELDELNGDLK